MDNVDLANKENELYSIVLEAHGTMEDKAMELRDKGVYDNYRQIHSSYADNSDKDLESLKRGLFIQWYAMSEPSCFTGINELDLNAEQKIINQIDRLITTDNLDYELNWMLKYYSTWDYVFERFKEFKGLQDWLKNQMGIELPSIVDRNEMQQRGQMGKYWNSLNRFKK
jgi:hypothetical protein